MTDAAPAPAPAASPAPRRTGRLVLLLLVIAASAAGSWWYLTSLGHESTDDAFVAADVHAVNAKVPGRLLRVLVADNQLVAAGDLLAEIEPADYEARLQKAKAALALAQAALQEATVSVGLVDATTQQAEVQATAEIQAAEARLAHEQAAQEAAATEASRTEADRQRFEKLSEQAVSKQRLESAQSAAVAAAASLRAAQQRTGSAGADVAAARARAATATADRRRVAVAEATVARRRAEVAAAEAELHAAELDLASTRITAPAAGRVTKKSVLAGQFLQPGQNLMALVGTDCWVVANFKETQLAGMAAGQRATVHIDAYGIDVPAHVDSIQAGSGAAFSLLPAENATGNYVKVVQRVPVKIRFEQQPDPQRYRLGPGMSVVPTVHQR